MSKKKVLGRGLGALIGENAQQGGGRPVVAGGVAEIGHVDLEGGSNQKTEKRFFLCEVGDIRANKHQPRKTFNEVSLRELSDSIKENGIIEPLVVKRSPVGYELIAGERRLRASKLAGLEVVPVVVLDVTDEESLELAIIENIQREDLNAIEEAQAYQALMAFGLSQDGVAKKVGKQRATVANYLRLLKLPSEVKEELKEGSITMGHARALLSLDSHAAQREICKKVISGDLSVRATESMVKAVASGEDETRAAKEKNAETEVGPVEDELRRIFGTKVILNEAGKKGRFEILYFSVEERERLIDLFRSLAG